MGTIHVFPGRQHARASSIICKPKTDLAHSFPSRASASVIKADFRGGILPRARQLETAGTVTPVKIAVGPLPPRASMTSSTELSMPLDCSHNVKLSTLHGLAIETILPVRFNKGMIESNKSLAARVKMTREALGLTPAELCKRIKIKQNRWSQYESGERRITHAVAMKLCDEFNLSMDWIYRNDPSNLPHALRLKMRQEAA